MMIGPPSVSPELELHPSRQNVWAAATRLQWVVGLPCLGKGACGAQLKAAWKHPRPSVLSFALSPHMSSLSYTESWPTSNTTPHHLHPNQTHQALGLKLASNMRCLRKKITHFKFVRPSERLLLAFLKWFIGNCHTCLLVKRQGWKIAKQMRKKKLIEHCHRDRQDFSKWELPNGRHYQQLR